MAPLEDHPGERTVKVIAALIWRLPALSVAIAPSPS
jgi:hypothetical protein